MKGPCQLALSLSEGLCQREGLLEVGKGCKGTADSWSPRAPRAKAIQVRRLKSPRVLASLRQPFWESCASRRSKFQATAAASALQTSWIPCALKAEDPVVPLTGSLPQDPSHCCLTHSRGLPARSLHILITSPEAQACSVAACSHLVRPQDPACCVCRR